MPTYNQNIPNATDEQSQSQADIKGNFQALNPIVVTGQLPYLTLPVTPSTPTFGSGTDGVYNLNYSVTSLNELFIHKQTASSGTAEIPFSASILSTNLSPGADGWTYLPSGIILRWESGVGSGDVIMTITPGGPAFTQILAVIVSPVGNLAGDLNFAVRYKGAISLTQLGFYVSSRTNTGPSVGNQNFEALIIGY